MSALFIAVALCFTGTGMWVISYWAPRCPFVNPCRRFILISPLHYANHWGDGKKEEDDSPPWWFKLTAYCVIMSCMIWPLLGFIVLFAVAMWMAYRFIQKITETGPYAQQKELKNEATNA